MGFVDQGSDSRVIDHDQTSNRTHDGDSIEPENVASNTVSADGVVNNAIYPTPNDIPAEYEQEGAQAYTESEGLVVFEEDS